MARVSHNGLTLSVAQTDIVAQTVNLDMVEAGCEPTVDTHLNRAPKARILEAVRAFGFRPLKLVRLRAKFA